jgi:integrase
MPDLEKRLTKAVAAALPLPAEGYALHWCPKTTGFGVRISATGDRAYIAQRRVAGKSVRRTLGKASGVDAISEARARELFLRTAASLQEGDDPLEAKRAERAAQKVQARTLDVALRDYVKTKRRAKDGLPLKPRTKADYLAMLEPATKRRRAGDLYALADRPLAKITADHIRRLFADLEARGERQRTYAMQVLRAVLRHEGVAIEGNPLASTTAGAQRVPLAASRGNPSPIPSERLGAWWRAACGVASVSGDQLRFMLLTGARPGEAAGLLVGDVDLVGMRAVLRDTKNRRDHTLVLSTQAAAIVSWHCEGKKASEPVFGVADTGKTLATINAAAKTLAVTPHKLRHTFASIADDLVTAATARVMLNHSSGDVAQQHYIGVSETKLREGWQRVADHIEASK